MPKIAMLLCMALGALGFCASLAAPAQAEKRVALVVGNDAYTHVPKLATAINDARAIGAALNGLGFTVLVAENQTRQEFSRALLTLDKAIEPGDTALFFFAGHGFEIHGQNYLLPTDVPSARENEEELLRDASLPVERIVDRMQARGARVVLLVLDACRDNPFEQSGTRGLRGTGGLASMTPVEGVFVVYSAGAKQRALDRLSRNDKNPNSVFTRNFTRELTTPGLTLVQIAKRTQTSVKALAASVGHEQTPAYYDQIVGDIVISTPAGGAAVAAAAAPSPQIAALQGLGTQGVQRDNSLNTAANTPADQLITDLDALAETQSWRELHDHLTDVTPSARDTHWQALVEQAAVGELGPLSAPGGSAAERLETIERYYPKFPSLAGSTRFQALRTAVGLDAFAGCFDETGPYDTQGKFKCASHLERFVRIAPVSVGLTLGAIHLVELKLNRYAAVPFYPIGLDAPGGEAMCDDSELPLDIKYGLMLPPGRPEPKIALTVVERCWNAVKTPIVANLAQETGASYYLQNVCASLIQHKAVSGLREQRCQAVIDR